MDHPDALAAQCMTCGAPTEFLLIRQRDVLYRLCSWSCLMVFAAGKEQDFRIHLVDLAEQHSSALRAFLTRAAANGAGAQAEIALDQLDEILRAIRAGA